MLGVAGLSQTMGVEPFIGWVSLIQYNTSDMFAFVLLSCLFCAALWSPAGMFYCVLSLSHIVPVRWYLIVSIHDFCLLLYLQQRLGSLYIVGKYTKV